MEALGGKKRSRSVVCTQCNEHFSQAIDKHLPEGLEFFRCHMNIPPGDAPAKVFARGVDTGSRYIVYAGGRRELLVETKEAETVVGNRKTKKIQVSGDFKRCKKVVDGVRNSGKYSETLFGPIKSTRMREPISPEKQPGIGSEEQYRSVAKMAFNYLGLLAQQGRITAEPHGKLFGEIREYIRNGVLPRVGNKVCDIEGRRFFNLPAPPNPLYNRITVFFSPETASVYGYVEVLGSFKFSVLLSDIYNGEKTAYSITNLPAEAGPDQETKFTDFAPVSADRILSRPSWQQNMRVAAKQLEHLIELNLDYDTHTFRQRAIRETFDELGVREGGPLTPDRYWEFADRLTKKIIEGEIETGVIEERWFQDWADLTHRR